jgi:tetratricopeptide (TPR) repeat protein
LAERIAHPFSMALALQYTSMVHIERGEPDSALQRLEAAELLAIEQRLSFVVEPQLLRGAVLATQARCEEAVIYLHKGLAGPGAARVRCYGLAWLARALCSLGRHREALAAATEGLNLADTTGHRQWEAELRRQQGMALCGVNELPRGQTALKEAISTARRQQAKSYELRAAISLARIWGDEGKRAEGRALLAPILGWFTEGFDTADLKEAAMLLDALR